MKPVNLFMGAVALGLSLGLGIGFVLWSQSPSRSESDQKLLAASTDLAPGPSAASSNAQRMPGDSARPGAGARRDRLAAVADPGGRDDERASAIVEKALRSLDSQTDEATEALDGWLEGVVVDESGKPLAGATVVTSSQSTRSRSRIYRRSTQEIGRGYSAQNTEENALNAARYSLTSARSRLTAVTGADGRFRFDGLEEGAHSVSAFKEGYSVRGQTSETAEELELVAKRVHTYSLDLRLPDGTQPAEAILVRTGNGDRELGLWTPDAPEYRGTEGQILLKAVAGDIHRAGRLGLVGDFTSEPVSLRAGGPQPAKLELREVPLLRIRVEDQSSERPRIDPWVRVARVGDNVAAASPAERDRSGPFVVTGLTGGSYQIAAGRGSQTAEIEQTVVVGTGAVDVTLTLGELDTSRYFDVRCTTQGGDPVREVRFQLITSFASGGRSSGSAIASPRGPGRFWIPRDAKQNRERSEPVSRVLIARAEGLGERRVDIDGSMDEIRIVFERACATTVIVDGDLPGPCRVELHPHPEGQSIAELYRGGGTIWKDLSPSGTAHMGLIQPGNYFVILRGKLTSDGSEMSLDWRSVQLTAEEETIQLAAPAISPLTVRVPDGKEGHDVSMRRADPELHSLSHRLTAKIGEDLTATFPAVPTGEWAVTIRTGPGSRRMEITVPCADFTFASMPVTGIQVTQVTPEKLADQAGLQVGDLIVAIGGQPVSKRSTGELYRKMREGAVNLSVSRGGGRRSMTIDSLPEGKEGWDEIGARFTERTMQGR